VTGGSKGIGLETARLLAREGARVLICARRESALAEAAADIRRITGCAVATQSLDVTSVEQIAGLPDAIGQTLGGIDIRVNRAGTGTCKPFLEVSDAELLYGMAVNVFATWEREIAKRPLSGEEAERIRHEWSANQGMRATRWGTPEELASVIVFAASDAASYVNGAVLVADGAQGHS